MKRITFIALIALAMVSSCYRDVEDELYPGTAGSCDTTGITYSTTITPILQNNGCMNCHSGNVPSGGISLQSHSLVKIIALDGRLYGAINHGAGYSPMPKGGNKMSSCDLRKVKAWIDAGAPGN